MTMDNSKCTIGYLIIPLLIGLFTGCSDLSGHNNPNRKYYIGKFILDLNKSKLRSFEKDSNLYKTMTLEIKNNDSFYFSMNAPFVRQKVGEWTMRPIDNLYLAYFVYDSTQFGRAEDQIYFKKNGDLEINSPIGTIIIGKEGQGFSDNLYFRRIK